MGHEYAKHADFIRWFERKRSLRKAVLRKCRTQSIKDNIKEKGHKKASVSRCFFLIQIAASPAAVPVEAVAVGSGQEAGEQGLCQWEQGIRGRVFRTDTEAPQLPGT